MAATITEFTATEMDWIDRATINGKREILEQELVDAPKDSLLRQGVIIEKNGKIIVAPEYADMFHRASAKTAKAAKITKKDDTMTENAAAAAATTPPPTPPPPPPPPTTTKQVQIHHKGFAKITSKLMDAFEKSIDEKIPTMYLDTVFGEVLNKLVTGFHCTNDDEHAIELGKEARNLLVAAVAANQNPNQEVTTICSTVSAKKTRLAAIAAQEGDWFHEVRVCNDVNPKQVEFTGPEDAAIAAAIIYTYNAIICNRHAQRAYDDAKKAGTGTTNVYGAALAEAVAWLG